MGIGTMLECNRHDPGNIWLPNVRLTKNLNYFSHKNAIFIIKINHDHLGKGANMREFGRSGRCRRGCGRVGRSRGQRRCRRDRIPVAIVEDAFVPALCRLFQLNKKDSEFVLKLEGVFFF